MMHDVNRLRVYKFNLLYKIFKSLGSKQLLFRRFVKRMNVSLVKHLDVVTVS